MTTMTHPSTDDPLNLDQQKEAELLCKGCELDLSRSLNNLRRTDGNGNWFTFCGEDCYREWCEDMSWRYVRLVDELNQQFRKVERSALDAKAAHDGKRDGPDNCRDADGSWNPYPHRSGTLYGILLGIVGHCRYVGIGRKDIYQPMDPDLKESPR